MGSINTMVSLFWWWFEHHGWHKWPFNKIPGLSIPPDLRGRWKGHLKRVGTEEELHDFILEITQTYSKIGIVTLSKNSRGSSVTAAILRDDHKSHYRVITTWQTKTKNKVVSEKEDEFYGTSIIEVEATSSTPLMDRKLIDFYYTRRNPHTRGHVEVKWTGLKLYDSFEIR